MSHTHKSGFIVKLWFLGLLFFLAGCKSMLERTKTTGPALMPGYVKTGILAREDFSKGLGSWVVEGNVTTKIQDGELRLASFNDTLKNPKGNIWWTHHFKTPFVLEFDYQSTTDHGLSMLFWNAYGLDGKDVFSWKRTGKYEEYVNANLKAYHLSFHRFKTGISNIRKAPGFHLVSSQEDPIKPTDHEIHKIVVASTTTRQRIFIDGELIDDFTDKGESCLNDKNWQHRLPCIGTGEPTKQGAIGLRHTQKQIAHYDNFTVYGLVKN